MGVLLLKSALEPHTEAACPPCRLIQLNWMTNKVYFFSKADLERRTEAATPLRDGWGVTHNGSALVVSDGSASLHWLDPESLKLLHSVQVGSRIWGLGAPLGAGGIQDPGFRARETVRPSMQLADRAPAAGGQAVVPRPACLHWPSACQPTRAA